MNSGPGWFWRLTGSQNPPLVGLLLRNVYKKQLANVGLLVSFGRVIVENVCKSRFRYLNFMCVLPPFAFGAF